MKKWKNRTTRGEARPSVDDCESWQSFARKKRRSQRKRHSFLLTMSIMEGKVGWNCNLADLLVVVAISYKHKNIGKCVSPSLSYPS